MVIRLNVMHIANAEKKIHLADHIFSSFFIKSFYIAS